MKHAKNIFVFAILALAFMASLLVYVYAADPKPVDAIGSLCGVYINPVSHMKIELLEDGTFLVNTLNKQNGDDYRYQWGTYQLELRTSTILIKFNNGIAYRFLVSVDPPTQKCVGLSHPVLGKWEKQ
ncbi:MAG: hypothetical protein KGI50_03905 [Patescibacteria group bacterium]|nr:hypothetical protein [Patescibacteria group bacterium]MDE2438431.1 hypothetical protein [Patescibacteria group bacterium]